MINFRGKKYKSWDSLDKNFKYIKLIFFHYKKVFKKSKFHKIHGDLTLDNVFFRNKEIFIFDWEFYGAKKYFWGYDLVYLTLSSVCIPFLTTGNFTKEEKKKFIKLMFLLKDMGIERKIISSPFDYFEKVLFKDSFLNKSVKISKSKFFPLITPRYFKNKILKIINSEVI